MRDVKTLNVNFVHELRIEFLLVPYTISLRPKTLDVKRIFIENENYGITIPNKIQVVPNVEV